MKTWKVKSDKYETQLNFSNDDELRPALEGYFDRFYARDGDEPISSLYLLADEDTWIGFLGGPDYFLVSGSVADEPFTVDSIEGPLVAVEAVLDGQEGFLYPDSSVKKTTALTIAMEFCRGGGTLSSVVSWR